MTDCYVYNPHCDDDVGSVELVAVSHLLLVMAVSHLCVYHSSSNGICLSGCVYEVGVSHDLTRVPLCCSEQVH